VTTTKPCQTFQSRDVSAGNKISPDASNVLAWACLCRMLSQDPVSRTRAERQLAAAQATWVNRFADAVYKGTRHSQGKYCRWTRSGTHCVSSQDENPNWVVGFCPARWMTRQRTPSDAAYSGDCRVTFAFPQLCCGALKHECWVTFVLFCEHRSASFKIRQVRRAWDDGILTPFRLYVWVAQYCA